MRADVPISTRFHFLGIPGRIFFQVRHGESRKSLLLVDGGIQTHDPKTHGLSTTPFVKKLEGISPFDHYLAKDTHFLPKLSLITIATVNWSCVARGIAAVAAGARQY